jgi:hypothetical protein
LTPLRPLLNVENDAQWVLMMSWLIGAFLPDGSFSHLVLEGEQGSAKSTTARLLLSMIDPSEAGLSAPPKDETDATVSALSTGVLGYDNLSGCRADISDVFCRFSTGQGYRTRTLYTNLDLTVVSVKLPVLLNGIDATVMRPDLLERCIKLKLPFIPPQKRQTETDIWSEFAAIHPGCLGALLEAVSCGLRYLDTTRLSDPPRMADFCQWVVACEPALPWKPGEFMDAYRAMQEDATRALAEDDSLASSLVEWAGSIAPGSAKDVTAKDVLSHVNEITECGPGRDFRHWPSSPEALAHRLTRLAPILRAHGIDVSRLPRTMNSRSRWRFWREGPQGVIDFEADGIPIAA